MTTTGSAVRATVPDAFRTAMGGLAAGVCVVTTTTPDGRLVGTTVSTGLSVSMAPPVFGVCLDQRSRTLRAVLDRGAFVGNVLDGGAHEVARLFASRVENKFDGVEHRVTARGLPWLVADAVDAVECEVAGTTEIGDHVIVLGSVASVHGGAPDGATSLAYVARQFFSLPRATA